MSSQTKVYYYKQRQQVVLLESTSAIATRGYEIVYSKELYVTKGVDNVLEFAFVNQDQKYVSIDGKDVTFRLLDRETEVILLQKQLTHILPVTGITSIVLDYDELEPIQPQQCYYTLEITDSGNRRAVYVDSAGKTRGVINIEDGTMPGFVSSTPLTIPAHPPLGSTSNVTYWSSTFSTENKNVLTVQNWYDAFTGSTYLQGSIVQDFSVTYDITQPTTYTDYTGTEIITIDGFHPYVRLMIINEGTPAVNLTKVGEITQILVR
jgi:hypothetical protein